MKAKRIKLIITGSEGIWKDRWTNQSADFHSIPWDIESEPTGFLNENCSGQYKHKQYYTYLGSSSILKKIDLNK